MRLKRLQAAILLATAVAPGCGVRAQPLVLATTTSVGNSGLLDVLTPALRHDLSIDLRPHLVGSGLSLRMLENGDADVALSHAPEREAATLARHPRWKYRKLMFNEFVIVGPPQDPAHVRDATSAAEAMRSIAAGSVRFASRGDSSGTYEREQRLWQDAGARPVAGNLITTGQGMAATLRAASAIRAYALTDRATFSQLEPVVESKLLFEGDPVLLNTYAVIVPTDRAESASLRAATRLTVWLTEGRGRELIAGFLVRGRPAFTVWPANRPGSTPSDLPH